MTSHPTNNRWNDMVVPAAKGLERFFWNLAWFTVIVVVLFGGPCPDRSNQHGGRNYEQRRVDSAGQPNLPDLQHEAEGGER